MSKDYKEKMRELVFEYNNSNTRSERKALMKKICEESFSYVANGIMDKLSEKKSFHAEIAKEYIKEHIDCNIECNCTAEEMYEMTLRIIRFAKFAKRHAKNAMSYEKKAKKLKKLIDKKTSEK